jgi:CheY-like chemotaxis protein
MAKVLIVDDHDDIGRVMARLVRRSGHEAEYVTSGEAALEHLRAAASLPDLVILDVMMPRVDGLEVLRALRQEERTVGLPVVMFSAMSEDRFRERALQTGASDYWVKGAMDLAQLDDHLLRYLGPGTPHGSGNHKGHAHHPHAS